MNLIGRFFLVGSPGRNSSQNESFFFGGGSEKISIISGVNWQFALFFFGGEELNFRINS